MKNMLWTGQADERQVWWLRFWLKWSVQLSIFLKSCFKILILCLDMWRMDFWTCFIYPGDLDISNLSTRKTVFMDIPLTVLTIKTPLTSLSWRETGEEMGVGVGGVGGDQKHHGAGVTFDLDVDIIWWLCEPAVLAGLMSGFTPWAERLVSWLGDAATAEGINMKPELNDWAEEKWGTTASRGKSYRSRMLYQLVSCWVAVMTTDQGNCHWSLPSQGSRVWLSDSQVVVVVFLAIRESRNHNSSPDLIERRDPLQLDQSWGRCHTKGEVSGGMMEWNLKR